MPISNTYLSEIQAKAEKAKDKKALYGPDIDLSRYTQHIERGKIESLESLSRQAKEAAIMTGINLRRSSGLGHFSRLISRLSTRA